MLSIEEFLPTTSLKPYIKAYKIIESSHAITNRVVPDTSCAMAFCIKGQLSYLNHSDKAILPPAIFSGLRTSVRLINYAPQTISLIVLFKEMGVSAFFRPSVHELFEKSIPLNTLFPPETIALVEEQLAETKTNQEKINIIEQFLCSKLFQIKTDTLVLAALHKIYANHGLGKIKDLTNSLNISQDAFEKRFRKITGTTPKQFSTIVKLKNMVRENPPASFIDMALANNYYDQSHFNKDFKRFTGQMPTDFFKSASYW
ncbi:MAG: helix-turn-helix domain-containing protein [Cyclobacteriaceae bacterium]|nr:helix-turn-helix domain-containing protein [Cyclobacteriaceae bacterium]